MLPAAFRREKIHFTQLYGGGAVKRLGTLLTCAILAVLSMSAAHSNDASITLGGYDWSVRQTSGLEGPGPNYFSVKSVSVSSFGILLGAKERKPFFSKKRMECAEIQTTSRFPYGSFELDFSRKNRFDSRAVFGFFLYDGDTPPNFSEVDFEAARWGVPENAEGLFTVQPGTFPGQSSVFSLPAGSGAYTVRIDWTRERIECVLSSQSGDEIARWSYAGKSLPLSDVEPETVHIHANFWLFSGSPPAGDGELSVLLTGFRYRPEKAANE